MDNPKETDLQFIARMLNAAREQDSGFSSFFVSEAWGVAKKHLVSLKPTKDSK